MLICIRSASWTASATVANGQHLWHFQLQRFRGLERLDWLLTGVQVWPPYKHKLTIRKMRMTRHKHRPIVVPYKSIWFLDSTNLQTLSVKISWKSEIQIRSYIGFAEATFGIFKTMDKKSSTGMPNLNAVVQTPMMQNALDAQNQQLFRKHNKSPQNSFGQS